MRAWIALLGALGMAACQVPDVAGLGAGGSSSTSGGSSGRVMTGDPITDCPFGELPSARTGVAHLVLNAMDFDRNGTAELATWDETGVYNVDAQPLRLFDAAEGLPVPGDFDGDGATDMAFFSDEGTWHIQPAPVSGGSSWSIAFGMPDATPVAGDFDGDGAANLAFVVRHPDTDALLWMVGPSGIPSLDGAAPVIIACRVFGGGKDLPLPLDVDLDGLTDLVVHGSSGWRWNTSRQGDDEVTPQQLEMTLGTVDQVPIAGLYGEAEGAFGLFSASQRRWVVRRFADGHGTLADATLQSRLLEEGSPVSAAILAQLGERPDGGGLVRSHGFSLWSAEGTCDVDKEMDGSSEHLLGCTPPGRRVLQPHSAVFIQRGLNGE